MANKIKIKRAIYVILFIILLIILLIPRNYIKSSYYTKENFASSIDIYKDYINNGTTPDDTLDKAQKYDSLVQNNMNFMNLIDDNKSIILMKRCYQVADTLDNLINQHKLNLNLDKNIQMFNIITNDFSVVESTIITKIQEAHDTILNDGMQVPIHGPAYVILTQVPYYKDNTGKTFSVINPVEYNYNPSYSAQTNGINSQQQIFYYVMILYPRYDELGRLTMANADTIPIQIITDLDNNNISREQQCYMHGVGTGVGVNKLAGCATATDNLSTLLSSLKILPTNAVASQMTDSMCLGPKPGNNLLQTDQKDIKNTPSTYITLYSINQTATGINQFFFNGIHQKVSDENKWIYLAATNPPFKINSDGNVQCVSNDGKDCAWQLDQTSSDQVNLLNDLNYPTNKSPKYNTYICDGKNNNSWCANVLNNYFKQ